MAEAYKLMIWEHNSWTWVRTYYELAHARLARDMARGMGLICTLFD
jgi:hypothetical protein